MTLTVALYSLGKVITSTGGTLYWSYLEKDKLIFFCFVFLLFRPSKPGILGLV